jgi:hypothetical protein
LLFISEVTMARKALFRSRFRSFTGLVGNSSQQAAPTLDESSNERHGRSKQGYEEINNRCK